MSTAHSHRHTNAPVSITHIPAGEPSLTELKAGQTLRLLDLEGNQAVDTLFYSLANPRERYDVQRTLRRQNNVTAQATTLRVADLELNLISHEASRNGELLTLLPTEYKLLEFLMRNNGQIITRMMIFEEVWGYHFDPGTNLIDVHIGRLRKKIDPPTLTPLIRTVRGSGYVIAEPV